MNKYTLKNLLLAALVSVSFLLSPAQATKDTGNNKALKKLQMMVKDANTEKDRLTAENAKLLAELEGLKKQAELDKKAKTDWEGKEKKLSAEIAFQKKQGDELGGRLDEATGRIHEIIDKFNALNQAKNDLAMTHEQLKNTQQFTSTELKRCEANNIKMYEHSKAIVTGYQQCREKGLLETVMDAEPFTQIKSVESEKIAQEYEDKLRKQKFLKTEAQPSQP
jgi:chromosome segregation ATPase